jgi:hypothetical protein
MNPDSALFRLALGTNLFSAYETRFGLLQSRCVSQAGARSGEAAEQPRHCL